MPLCRLLTGAPGHHKQLLLLLNQQLLLLRNESLLLKECVLHRRSFV